MAVGRQMHDARPTVRWARDEIGEAILSEGYDEDRGTFLQAFGDPALDDASGRVT